MSTIMEKYNYTIIEDWWRHLGTFGREQVTPFPFMSTHEDACDFLEKSDNWWDSLTEEQKLEAYNEFFDES